MTTDSLRADLSVPSAPADADEPHLELLRTIGAIGWATRALVYLIVAGIVAKIALTGGAEPQQASKAGVLSTLLDKPFGAVLVVAVALGAVTYAAARIAPLFLDDDDAGWATRARAVGSAGIYLSLAYACWRLLKEQRSGDWGDDAFAQQATSEVLGHTWGVVALLAIAAVLIGYGIWQLRRAWTCSFLHRIDRDRTPVARRWVRILGRAGFASRGAIAITAGVFVTLAAIRHDPADVHGLDGSFRTLLQGPFGTVVVLVLAAGLACFAGYCAMAAAARDHENA